MLEKVMQQMWSPKGSRKQSTINKQQQDRTNDGTKRGSAVYGTEDPSAQETHLNSKITHLKIPT